MYTYKYVSVSLSISQEYVEYNRAGGVVHGEKAVARCSSLRIQFDFFRILTQPHFSHMSHTPFFHISECNSTSVFSLFEYPHSNPISPICRTPLSPISRNVIRQE